MEAPGNLHENADEDSGGPGAGDGPTDYEGRRIDSRGTDDGSDLEDSDGRYQDPFDTPLLIDLGEDELTRAGSEAVYARRPLVLGYRRREKTKTYTLSRTTQSQSRNGTHW